MSECKHIARQLALQERFRCKCGIFVKTPEGVPPGKDCVVQCTRGHDIKYHSPATYYVMGERDPISGLEGKDTNTGLSPMEPLKTIGEAISRCASPDMVMVGDSSKKNPIKLQDAIRGLFRKGK